MRGRVGLEFFAIAAFICLVVIGFAVTHPFRSGGYKSRLTVLQPLQRDWYPCVLDAEQNATWELAMNVLESPVADSSLTAGARESLGKVIASWDSNDQKIACMPDDISTRAAAVFEQHLAKGWAGWSMDEYGLRLAAQIKNPPPGMIEKVAKAAFPKERQLPDVRPLARNVLAGYGRAAAPYAEQARQEMSVRDTMGTTAAQVVAASGVPNGAEEVSKLLENALVSADPTIDWEDKNRLYEIAYGLSYAGVDAAGYTAPLKKLMAHRVQSWAMQFGMLEMHPARMCTILDRIDPQKPAKQMFAYCAKQSGAYER